MVADARAGLTAPVIRIARFFRVAPEKVFDAWLQPALINQWMAPGSLVARATVEPKEGGTYRIFHLSNGVEVGGFDARIVTLDRPTRLVFDWGFVGQRREAGPKYDSRLTLTFSPKGEGTRLVLLHEELASLAAALPEVAAHVGYGWEDVLAKLASVIQ